MKYFTSDTHFGHANVIAYCKRPFGDVAEMNAVMLANMQKTLTQEDDLYFLGDWCLHYKHYILLKEVPFRHLYFILGNHDQAGKLAKQLVADQIDDKVTVTKELTIQIGNRDFFLTHRPVKGSDDFPTLCGHVHEKWLFQAPGTELRGHKYQDENAFKILKQPVLNVGVDRHAFRPISEEEVLDFFARGVAESDRL